MRQKLRHSSAGRFYGRRIQLTLLLFHASNLLLWLGIPFLRVFSGTWYGAGFFAVRLIVQRAVLRQPMRDLLASDLSLAQPLLDFVYLLYNTLLAPLGAVLKPKRW